MGKGEGGKYWVCYHVNQVFECLGGCDCCFNNAPNARYFIILPVKAVKGSSSLPVVISWSINWRSTLVTSRRLELHLTGRMIDKYGFHVPKARSIFMDLAFGRKINSVMVLTCTPW